MTIKRFMEYIYLLLPIDPNKCKHDKGYCSVCGYGVCSRCHLSIKDLYDV